MTRGRKPKPTKLRLLEGARPSHVNQNEPIPSDESPQAPEGTDPAVRDVYEYTVRELEHMGLASTADHELLMCFAEAVITHRRACEKLHRSDVLIKGPAGPMRNPAVIIQRDSANSIRSLAAEFGLSPSARTRIQVHAEQAAADDDNPFADTAH